MQKATLPDFVDNAERAFVGPFALWAPHNVGPVRRWCGVDTSDPTVRLSVLTCANPSEPGVRWGWSPQRTVGGDFLWLSGGALLPTVFVGDDRYRVHVGTRAPAWIARRAHPGITLATLLAADSRGDPPRELLAGVVRALMSGVRSCEAIESSHDIVVGVDGVVTVDGFDLPRPGWWNPAGSPLYANPDECRRMVAAALRDIERDEIDELLAHVAATGDLESEREREFIAGVVAGLAPEVCRAEYDAAEQISLLGPAAWAAWGTPEGQKRADGLPPPASARDTSPHSTSRYHIASDVDVRFLGKMRGARSRFVWREPVLELAVVVGNADDFVASNHPWEWGDVAVVVGSGAIPAALPTIRASSLAEARRAIVIVCDFVESALHHAVMHTEPGHLHDLLGKGDVELTTHRVFVTSLAEPFDDFVARLRARPGLQTLCLCIVGNQWTTLQDIQGLVAHFEELVGDDIYIQLTYRVRSSRLCVEVIAVYSQALNR